jgi:hypothetical protein
MVGLIVILGPLLAVSAAEGGPVASALPPSACPDADAVWAAAANLMGQNRRPPPAARATLQVDDGGARYRVSIAGRERDVADEGRDCARRVQVAAVFVALTLAPPEVPQPEVAVASPSPAPAPSRRRQLRIEVAPALGVSVLGADDRAGWVGGLVRGFVPWSAPGGAWVLGALLDAGVGVGGDEATPGRVRERRLPFGAGLRWGWRGRRVELGLDLEAVATWLEVAPAGGGWTGGTLDGGGRLGGIVAFGGGRIMPLVGFFVDASPAPPALALEPDGVVGHASTLRAGGYAGLGFRLP